MNIREANRAGFSLLEVMVALLVLGVLAIGGASMIMRTGETVARQRLKRVAIEAANRRIEEVRATYNYDINALPPDGLYLVHNVVSNDLYTFVPRDGDVNETIEIIQGVKMPIITKVMPVPIPATAYFTNATCLEIGVRVVYRPELGDDEALARQRDDVVLTSHFYRDI